MDSLLQRKVWSALSAPNPAAASCIQHPYRTGIAQLPTKDPKMNDPHVLSVAEPVEERAASVPANSMGGVRLPMSPP